MKKSIIYLGIAVLTFSNVISALAQHSFIKGESLTQTVSSNASSDGNTNGNPLVERRNSNNSSNGEDTSSNDPATIIYTPYQKTIEEIIAENNQIIESTISPEQNTEENSTEDNQIDIAIEVSPVSTEKAMEERIIQDMQIIESSVLNTYQPIALEKYKKS
jgi:hypothetical protein